MNNYEIWFRDKEYNDWKAKRNLDWSGYSRVTIKQSWLTRLINWIRG